MLLGLGILSFIGWIVVFASVRGPWITTRARFFAVFGVAWLGSLIWLAVTDSPMLDDAHPLHNWVMAAMTIGLLINFSGLGYACYLAPQVWQLRLKYEEYGVWQASQLASVADQEPAPRPRAAASGKEPYPNKPIPLPDSATPEELQSPYLASDADIIWDQPDAEATPPNTVPEISVDSDSDHTRFQPPS